MFRGFLNKVYGNAVVLSNLRGQSRIPFLPEEELHTLRDHRLKKIVRFAAETVPYYQKLFQTLKINPREIRSVEDLDHLPLIDKGMVRKDPTHFVSSSRRSRTSIHFLTSGSTGSPLDVWHDPYSLLANIAFGEREREVITRVCGRRHRLRELYVFAPASTTKKVWNFYKQYTFIPIRPERLHLSVLDSVEDIVRSVNEFRPDILIGYGSYLETFFKTLGFRNISLHLPKVLVYGAEGMTTEGRNFIEEEFRIPVLSHYNAVEAFKIGFFCDERRGFHLHEDLCHVKIVDEKGKNLAFGEKGKIVISNLVNRGTVLLNYRLGDLGSISKEKCPCDRTLPILSDLEGRVEDTIFLPDGRFIHPRAVWGVIKRKEGVLKYQLIQLALDQFELKLVTVDRETYQRVVSGILIEMKNLLGTSSEIESVYCEELKPQEGGKFRSVLSLCKPR